MGALGLAGCTCEVASLEDRRKGQQGCRQAHRRFSADTEPVRSSREDRFVLGDSTAQASHELIAVLDTHAVEVLAPSNAAATARLDRLAADADDLLMSAAVLAEGVFRDHPGYDYFVRQLLRRVGIRPVTETLGREAGRLRHEVTSAGADPAPSPVDAMVAALADEAAKSDDVAILTGDPDDLGVLAMFCTRAERLEIRPT